jgi:hypothetical protein
VRSETERERRERGKKEEEIEEWERGGGQQEERLREVREEIWYGVYYYGLPWIVREGGRA